MRIDGLLLAIIGVSLVLLAFLLSWYKTGNDAHPILKWFFVAVGIVVAFIVYLTVATHK